MKKIINRQIDKERKKQTNKQINNKPTIRQNKINTDLVQGRAKPNPVFTYNLFPISHIKGSTTMSFRPAHTCIASIREYPLGLAFSLVMSQLSFIIFFPSPHYQMTFGVNWATWIAKRGDKIIRCIRSFRKSCHTCIDYRLHLLNLFSLLALIQALQINLLFFWFWGMVNS